MAAMARSRGGRPTSPFSRLPAEVMRHIGDLVGPADALCWRATCRAFRDARRAPPRTPRSAMLRSAALAAWAWEQRGFRTRAFPPAEQRLFCKLAARTGSVGALAWLRERRCEWDRDTCSQAAAGGHLAVLQWAREHGCAWDGVVCEAAAGGGHLAVLQWARAHGCAWGQGTCLTAAAYGRLAVLQWAVSHGCPWERSECVSMAAFRCNGEMAAWLRHA